MGSDILEESKTAKPRFRRAGKGAANPGLTRNCSLPGHPAGND
jgi:hypothetical protein